MTRPSTPPADSALRLAAALLLCALAPLSAASAQRARGADLVVVVTDHETGRPLPEAVVRVTDHSAAGRTDPSGRAELHAIRPGTRVLEVSRIGYAMERAVVDFEASTEPIEAEVELMPQAVELEGMVVTTWGRSTKLRNHGFYDRQRRGNGEFFTSDQIERLHPRQMVDVFRHTNSMSIGYDSKGRQYVQNLRAHGLGACQPSVFLDGMAMGRDMDGNVSLDFTIPENVAGMEVYAGPATIPAEYNLTGSACGVVLLWTK
jgi:hypothetical protein